MQIVASRIRRCPIDHHLHTLHCHHFASSLGQRQGKVAQAAEQIEYALIRRRLQPVQRLGDHRFVDASVDLDEISRPIRQLQVPLFKTIAQRLVSLDRLRFTVAMQPQLGLMERAEILEDGHVTFRQRCHVPQQNRQRRAAEQLHVPQCLRFAQAPQHFRQAGHDRLQGLYQHRAIIDADDVLAAGGTETDFEFFRLHVPAYRHAGATPVGELRTAQRWRPLFGFDARDLRQLLGEHALFQGKLFVMRQMLHAATAATAGMGARCRAARFAGLEHPFGARLDHFAVGTEDARLDLFTGQCADDEPGATFEKRDTATVIGQALDGQALLFAGRDLRGLAAAGGLEAQASLMLGHQLGASKMPVDR
ncbi:hypothetical protein D3C72_960830 [compost metagenome]